MEGAVTPPHLRPLSGGSTPRANVPNGNGHPTPELNGISSGAEIYRALMEGYHRRLRKSAPALTNDAAGLLNRDANFHGRGTPLKAKGIPPRENFEPVPRLSKRFVPGRSHKAEPQLLTHDPLNQSMDSAMFALAAGQGSRPASACVRPSLRICEASYRSSLGGAGLVAIAEQPPARRLCKPGQFSGIMSSHTKPRVMVHAEDVAPAPGTQTSPRSFLDSAWQKQMVDTKDSLAKDLYNYPTRPSTAPSTQARMRYHDANNANKDLFSYRHSGGICPKEYKFDATARNPAPQLTSPPPGYSRQEFDSNRRESAYNRVKGLLSRSCLYYDQ